MMCYVRKINKARKLTSALLTNTGISISLLPAILSSAAEAFAQQMPPQEISIDKNMVNLVTGSIEYRDLQVDIGNNVSGMQVSNFTSGPIANNFDGYLHIQFVQVGGGGGVIILTAGVGRLHTFRIGNANGSSAYNYGIFPNPGPYREEGNGGAWLSCTGNYQILYAGGVCSLFQADGTKIDYSMPAEVYHCCWVPNSPNVGGYINNFYREFSIMTRPDGEVITHYDFPGVGDNYASSLGFQARITPGKFILINSSKEYCNPAVTICNISGNARISERVAISSGSEIYDNSNLMLTVNYGPIYITPSGFSFGFVSSTTGPNGSQTRVFKRGTKSTTYYFPLGLPLNPSTPFTADVTNPNGSMWHYSVGSGKVSSLTDELGRKVTYSYQAPAFGGESPLLQVCKPSNAAGTTNGCTSYTYAHGALTSMSTRSDDGASSIGTSMGVPTTCDSTNYKYCNKPSYVIDARGNRTDYTYDPLSGGVLTETLPPDINGVRPQKRFTYTMLYPRILNASGALTNSTPVWRLTRISECRTATPQNPASCLGTDQERVTTYLYDDDNLFRTSETISTGNGSQSITNTYLYNYAGDVTSDDGPRSDVDDRTYTTYDVLRRPVYHVGADPDGSGPLPRQIVRHVYDIDGREWKTEYGTGFSIDGSDFTTLRFVRRTFDPDTNKLSKEEVVVL